MKNRPRFSELNLDVIQISVLLLVQGVELDDVWDLVILPPCPLYTSNCYVSISAIPRARQQISLSHIPQLSTQTEPRCDVRKGKKQMSGWHTSLRS
jgi:hypothetical protein